MSQSLDALEIYRLMARYNTHLSAQLLLECSKFDDETRKTARGVPFGSLHGLWNHLLLTNRIWLGRFENRPIVVTSLGEELFGDWDELCAAHHEINAKIEAFAASLEPEILSATLRYKRFDEPRELPYFAALSHFFNHQTHHRGQITALIEQLGGDCGVTDLAAMPEFLARL